MRQAYREVRVEHTLAEPGTQQPRHFLRFDAVDMGDMGIRPQPGDDLPCGSFPAIGIGVDDRNRVGRDDGE